uniref:Uncharacterized protein n=1 Tax=Arcella intermedia TaxID=1963864 RepID=A0A6B2LTP4_9EUKA
MRLSRTTRVLLSTATQVGSLNWPSPLPAKPNFLINFPSFVKI